MSEYTNNTSHVLGKIASLTAIRDMDMFEFSFLKSLSELLTAKNICLYKSTDFSGPCSRLRYTSTSTLTTPWSSDAFKTDSVEIQVEIEEVNAPREIIQAQDWIQSTNRFYSIQKNDLFFIVYPINGLKGVVGYLSLELFEELSNTEIQVISNLLSFSRNFYSLLEENQKDKLTGLLNRKTFDTNISKIKNILNSEDNSDSFSGTEKRQEISSGNQFWLAIMDIDHFKRINDTFGHIYGDEVLLLLSQVMKKTFRAKDLLFRYGGEEFVTILQVEYQQTAEHILERFRKTIEEFIFPQVGTVTISIGVTQIVEECTVASELVGRADQALYHAKETGRNRLFFYETLIEDGILSNSVVGGDVELF